MVITIFRKSKAREIRLTDFKLYYKATEGKHCMFPKCLILAQTQIHNPWNKTESLGANLSLDGQSIYYGGDKNM